MKKLILNMSRNQYKQIDGFLAKNKIFRDGKKKFYLLAQPKINSKEIDVLLINPKQGDRLTKVFEKEGLI